MTSRNDITGDAIASKQPTDAYRSGWDAIFAVCSICGERKEPTHDCQPAERQWRGLTTAERKVLWNATKKPTEYAELIEAKLKERNAVTNAPE